MYNKVILIGNLGNDAEVRVINEENRIISFSLATTNTYKNKQGEKVTDTQWHNCEYWNKSKISDYLKKGTKVQLDGSIKYEKYDKDGVTKYVTKIIVSNVLLLSSIEKPKEEPNKPSELVNEVQDDDDLPF